MTLRELQETLRAVEPAAVLVPTRVLENIICQSWHLSTFRMSTPRRHCYVIDRQTLFRHVEQEELVLASDQLLPSTVILIAWPTSDMMQSASPEALSLGYWQRLFHGSVEMTLENLWAEGVFTPAILQERLAGLGGTEFEEIRSVLIEDLRLPADTDDRLAYFEFAALYLEHYYFAPSLLDGIFPGLRDHEAVKKLLEQDIDADEILRRTRLAKSPDPVVQTPSSSQEAHEFYWKLIGNSEWAAKQGNVVLSAIQKRRAARVAPPALAYDTMQGANADLRSIAARLRAALELNAEETDQWMEVLPILLDKADQGSHPAEAALLYDLQKVCVDHEEEIYTLDLIEWLRSLGKRPIKRPLPGQRLVRMTRHLRKASQRLTMARLSDSDRKNLDTLVHKALTSTENNLRERFRPIFVSALEDVGLKPNNPPERTAFAKMIEEMLDRILASGFITFSDLRDTLSRNLLKLPDLSDPQDFIRGDPLLRLDRRLATLLDGVYRRSDFYLRWLERFTALNFGTKLGRLLTQFVFLPFGGAFLILAAIDRFILQHIQSLQISLFFERVGTVEQPLSVFSWHQVLLLFLPTWIPLSAFLLGLIHSRDIRMRTKRALGVVGRSLRRILIEGPLWLIRNPAYKKIARTWSFQLFYWYFFKPLVVWAIVLWLFWGSFGQMEQGNFWFFNVCVFFAANFLLNSGPGLAMGEAITNVLVAFIDQLRAGLLPTLYRVTVRLFQTIGHFLEALLFRVDELLRFRGDEDDSKLFLRGLLNVIWFPIGYLARFNFVVLIEPAFNPLKFPVASIATKFWAGPAIALLAHLQQYNVMVQAIGYWIIFWFPDVFGFLFWEIKENWSLYRANRSSNLEPVGIGPAGETMKRLLQPGFHSGAIPKLFRRLRKAERLAHQTGHWGSVRSCQAALETMEEAIRLFVSRDFLALLKQDPNWKDLGVSVGSVILATNQIRVALLHPQHPNERVVLDFESHAGWVVAGVEEPGWLQHLAPALEPALHNALVTLYKLAGVDMVREQLQAVMPSHASYLDITQEGLAFRLDGRATPAVCYNIKAQSNGSIQPQLQDGEVSNSWPELPRVQLLFSQIPVTWDQCVRSWQVNNGHATERLLPEIALLPRTPARPSYHDVNGEAITENPHTSHR